MSMNNPLSLFDIKGRTAVITGATGTLGRMASKLLGGAGANLVLAGGNKTGLQKIAEEVGASGAKVITVNCRPDSADNSRTIVEEAVAEFDSVNLLLAASGMNFVSPIAASNSADWWKVMDANVHGSWLICQAFGRQLIKQESGGKIVLISSTRGKLGHRAGFSVYSPSKAAIDSLTRTLAFEWGEYGITVNAIGPTLFKTESTAWMFADDEKGSAFRKGILPRIPLNRLGVPEDLAGAILFLLSPASDFCTGQIIYVDGGFTAG